jgi:arginase family enzyme
MDKLHFIKAPAHQSSRKQGFQFAPDEIKETYDHEFTKEVFSGTVINIAENRIDICPGHNMLYQYILNYSKQYPTQKIVTIGGDHSVASGSISGINHKYLKKDGTSDLVIIWIDSSPDILDFSLSKTKNLDEIVMGSLLGFCASYTNNTVPLDINQIIYYGLSDKDDSLELVTKNQIQFFTKNKINSIGIDNIVEIIKKKVGNRPVHISLDMKVFDKKIAPCVIPQNENGMPVEHVEKLLVGIKNNIVSMDIVEFNPLVGSNNDSKITRETIRYILTKTFDLKEKSINIFSEDSKFLIFRPIEQTDPITDIGWYILRGLPLKEREELIKFVPDDTIITIDLDNDDGKSETYYVTKTDMNEQNLKSYCTSLSIQDTTLFPEEKVSMCFELLNT